MCVPSFPQALRDHLLSKTGIPTKNVHVMAQGVSPEDAAAQYQQQLATIFGDDIAVPRYDA